MNNAASAGSVTLALYGFKPPIANFDVLNEQMNVFSPLKDGYTP